MPQWRDDPASVRPMLASTQPAPLDSPALAYEPKYDGIRALAAIDAGEVRFWSRLGNEKTKQFPEVAAALAPHTGNAQVIGITGAPGVGKSTSKNALVRAFREQGK